MSNASKVCSLVDTLKTAISPHVKSNHFRKFCKEIAPGIDNLSQFACLADNESLFKSHEAFINFCMASIWWEIAFQIKVAVLSDGAVEGSELKVAHEILAPAADIIAHVDNSWAAFSPLLESEVGGLLDFITADEPRLIRKYKDSSGELNLNSSLIVPVLITSTLATQSLDIAQLFKKAFTLAFKLIIQADGTAGDEERASYAMATQIADMRVETCRVALEHLLLAFEGTEQESKVSARGLADAACKPKNNEKQRDPEETLREAAKELEDLIGLRPVKEEITRLANYLKVEAKRKAAGLPSGKQSLHFVFTGNPGTGKTTVARIMSKLLFGYGVLPTATLIETDRGNLVGGFLGQTAIKTKEVIGSALDGVLFIDEAYTLAPSTPHGDQFGQEAIDTILKAMEDNRDRLVVIAAGYTSNMASFLDSNPGLKSRFTRFIDFPDYSPKDLCKIFLSMAQHNQYALDPEAAANLAIICHALFTARDRNFGNGRLVRNLFEKTLGNHADRVVAVDELTREVLTTIVADDLPYEMAGLRGKVDLTEERWLARCESCGVVHKAGIKLITKSVKCKCGSSFRVPCWSIASDGKPFGKLISVDSDEAEFQVWN